MIEVVAEGISIWLPKHWDGILYKRRYENALPILHCSNFALPPGRGDFGSGVADIMGNKHIFFALLEMSSQSASSSLFANKTLSLPLNTQDFHPNKQKKFVSAMTANQLFFVMNGRAFILYILLGSHFFAASLLNELNPVLESLEVR